MSEMGDKRHQVLTNKQDIIAKLKSFIYKVCRIPPKTSARYLSSSFRRNPAAVTLTTLFIIVTSIFLSINYLIPALSPVYPAGLRLPDVLDADFILVPRKPNIFTQDDQNFFHMRGSERLVIRDCTVYIWENEAPTEIK